MMRSCKCFLHVSKIPTLTYNRANNAQALVLFQKYMPPPLPYFKVNIYPYPLPHFASIFFAYLWPNYIVTLPRYFSFRLPHLNIPTRPPSDELDKNIQRTSLCLLFTGFFICIRNYLVQPCVTMPSWSSPLKCKVSL